jgi:hypothetical protein
LDSDARRRTLDIRATRARTCEAYSYDACCSRIPIVEALPSERAYDAANSLQCLVARPMIEFLIDQIRRDKAAIATKAKHAFGYRYLLTIFHFFKRYSCPRSDRQLEQLLLLRPQTPQPVKQLCPRQ